MTIPRSPLLLSLVWVPLQLGGTRRNAARGHSLVQPLSMFRLRLFLIFFLLCVALAWPAKATEAAETNSSSSYSDIDGPPHYYRTRTPQDRFTRAMEAIENDPHLDRSSEKAFLSSFLK